jgi:hypothetical protein
VHPVFQMRVQYFHGCGGAFNRITYDRHIGESTRTICDENAPFGVSIVRKLRRQSITRLISI